MNLTTHSLRSAPDEPQAFLFQAVITPHLSLDRRGAALVIGSVGVLNAITSGAFLLLGAWPVVGFLGLDVAAIALAFYVCRRAACRREELSLTMAELVIRDIPASGAPREMRFNPYWTRLRRHVIVDEGVVALDLTSHGRSLRIAAALSPPERADFADALDAALRRARAGGIVLPAPHC